MIRISRFWDLLIKTASSEWLEMKELYTPLNPHTSETPDDLNMNQTGRDISSVMLPPFGFENAFKTERAEPNDEFEFEFSVAMYCLIR